MAKATPGLAHLLLGQPDLAEGLMRSLALKGQLPQYIEPELNVSLTALNLGDPEFVWLRRTTRLSQGITLPAVAAQFSQGVFAPTAGAANARTLAVVEKLIITNLTGGNLQFTVDSQPQATVGFAPNVPKSALDDRAIPFNQLQPTPSFGLINATAAGSLGTLGNIVVGTPPSATVVLDLGWVFTARTVISTPAPSVLTVTCTVVNQAFGFSVVWRERALLSSEAL